MLKGSLPIQEINTHSPTVLIADDDEDSRVMLRTLLDIWNYRVLEAEDGAAVIRILKQECPDLILMDVKMPVFDGFETARQIRQLPENHDVPIIFLSA